MIPVGSTIPLGTRICIAVTYAPDEKLRGVSPLFVVAYVTAFLFFNHQKGGIIFEIIEKQNHKKHEKQERRLLQAKSMQGNENFMRIHATLLGCI